MSHFQSSSSCLVNKKSLRELFFSSLLFEYFTKKNATAKIKMIEQRIMISKTGSPPIPFIKYINGLRHSGFTVTGLNPF